MGFNVLKNALDTRSVLLNPALPISPPNLIKQTDHIGLDIGGSLTKIVYTIDNRVFLEKFATESIQEIFKFLEQLVEFNELKFQYVVTTGGGSYKFYENLNKIFTEKHKIEIIKKDEMECLIHGLNFLINDIPNEVFIMDHQTEKINYIEQCKVSYPYLLVNIGSGVSMIKVDGPDGNFQRIGGSSLGGGTLWGLLSLLTDCEDYDSMLKLSESGANKNVDMLVGDIYGETGYNKIGLKSSTIASSFGKVFNKVKRNKKEKKPNGADINQADIIKSLVYSISNNIGQISYLQANIHGVESIFFGGSYINRHHFIIKTLSYAINFWSKGEMQAHFLKHDGYIGAIGSFLMSPEDVNDYDINELEQQTRDMFDIKAEAEYNE